MSRGTTTAGDSHLDAGRAQTPRPERVAAFELRESSPGEGPAEVVEVLQPVLRPFPGPLVVPMRASASLYRQTTNSANSMDVSVGVAQLASCPPKKVEKKIREIGVASVR